MGAVCLVRGRHHRHPLREIAVLIPIPLFKPTGTPYRQSDPPVVGSIEFPIPVLLRGVCGTLSAHSADSPPPLLDHPLLRAERGLPNPANEEQVGGAEM